MSFFKRFSSLRWKLVFSYVIVTLLVILVLEGIVFLATDWLNLRFAAEWDNQSAPGLSPGSFGNSLLTTTLVLLPCIIPLGLFFGFVSTIGFTRRLGNLSEASNALAEGDLSRRVHDSSGDEIGQLGRQFDAMADQLEDDTNQLRELAESNARLAEQAQRGAAVEERHRLARELHDGVKQHLFGVNLATAAAINLLDSDPQAAEEKLMEAKDHSRQAQAEMQVLLNELRPAGLDDRGLVIAVTDHLTDFEQREEIVVDWQPEDYPDLPLIYEQALFRVAQEALTNVARHARATRVAVDLHTTPESVTLKLTDDGIGFDPTAAESEHTMGLQGMRERLNNLKGSLTVDSSPGKGTRLVAILPLSDRAREDKTYD